MQLGKAPSKFSSYKGDTTLELLSFLKNRNKIPIFPQRSLLIGKFFQNRYTNFYDALKTHDNRMDFYSI